MELSVDAKAGDCVDLSFAEVMDKEGNFYTENYRGAKAQYHYICSDGVQNGIHHLLSMVFDIFASMTSQAALTA